MVIPIENVGKLHCITGGIWQCYVYDKDFLDDPDPIPFRLTSVKMCNVAMVKNENDDVILTFDKPISCGIENNALNCGCSR